MSTEFHVPAYFDYLATFSWALSGAIVALRKRCDIVGVFVLALLTSVGGSILRDGIFLQRTPPVLTDPVYLPLITLATLFIALLHQRIAHLQVVDKLVSTIDAIGTPAFAVVGMQLALDAGIPLPGVVLVGVTTVESALEASAMMRPMVSIFLGPKAYPTMMLSSMKGSCFRWG